MDEPERPRTKRQALRDLLMVLLAVLALLWAGAATNLFEGFYQWLRHRFPGKVDEILVGLLLAAAGFGLLTLLRWLEARSQSQARSAAEQRYRALVEKIPAVTYTWDPTRPAGEIPPPYVSPQVEAILGFSVGEWKADPRLWIRQIHPEDRDRVLEASNRSDRTGQPFNIEYRHIKKDGTVIWLREEAVAVERDEAGRPLLVQGIMYDVTDRKRAEEHLAEAEARYRTLVERVPAVTYIWDAAHPSGSAPAPYISPQIEHLLGFTQDEFQDPQLWHRQVHPDDLERVLREWEACERGDVAFRSEYRMYMRDGRLVWIHDEAVPVSHDDEGHPVFQGVMFDITERKLAEQRLLEAEERFRTLVEQIPAITYIEDPESGRNLYISPQVEELFGYTPEEWTGDPALWEERLHPEDRERVVAENAAETGDRWSVDYRTIRKDGRPIWIHNESVLVRDPEGAPLFWQGVVFDITERKEAEQRLRDAEERFRTLVEQLPVVVYQDAVDDTSTALYISPQYERLFGYPPEARLTDPEFWINHLHPDDRKWVLAESKKTNETGDPFIADYRFIARDGRVVWVRDEAVLLRDADGRPLLWQGVLMDITERKLAEETLSRRDAVLEAVGFAAERFLKTREWEVTLPAVLERLGTAAGVSRVYVFENEPAEDAGPAMTLRCEWLAPGILSINDETNHRLPYRPALGRWEAALSAGGALHGLTRDFPEAERAGLQSEGVLALVIVPVFVGDEWWGFLGFDDCAAERSWPAAEIEALKTAADTLGAAIGRWRAERRQAETETRYRSLVETMPAVTYMQGVGHGEPVYYISPQIEQMLGYTVEEWGPSFDNWYRSIHPDDRERVLAEDDRTDETGEPFRIEYRQIAKDGRVVWVHDEAIIVRDSKGEPLFWQGVRFDITAQKQAEEHLREAEQRYRTLVETIPAVTYIDAVDEESTTVYVSPQIETMFGYTPERWKAEPELWWENLHSEDLERIRAVADRHNRLGDPFDVEYRFRAADGSWKWVKDQATIVRDERGGILFSQGVMFDITERRQAEDQLRETEAKYRALVEHIPAVLYIDPADEHASTLYVSPQVEEVLGVSQRTYLSDPDIWRSLIHPEDDPRVLAAYRESLATHEGWAIEYRVMRPDDGRTIWIRDESVFLPGENGAPALIQGVLSDITERKLAEQALRQSEQQQREAAERLRALDEMKNRFLSAVSHELRSPLTSILGTALTLQRHELPVEDRSDLVGRLASNARKLDKLLKDLLDVDRLSRGIVTPKYRPTDVGELVRRTVESMDLLGERSLLVEAEDVVVPVDPAKIERIVENLLANAVRHTEPDVGIWVRAWAEDGGAVIAVEDDGPGVPEELQREIFEPFRQGPTASPHAPGTGIGLSLVAMFAELHGGRAWVQEREGGGASFRVFLPGSPVEGNGHAPEAPGAAGRRFDTAGAG